MPRGSKTSTDLFWDKRARELQDSRKINIDDLAQRQIENDFVTPHLDKTDRILEVGCGNGFLTTSLREYVHHVDGFDYSESMIAHAKEFAGEKNNRFFHGSVLDPNAVSKQYDKVVCVRVLINLKDLAEQKLAVQNLKSWVKSGGKLILVEGYADAFDTLSELRQESGLPPVKPAAINFYSRFLDLDPAGGGGFDLVDTWDSGMFDVLTRVAYPLLVGPENATGPGEFHDKILPLAKAFKGAELRRYARLRGVVLAKH